MGKNQTHKAMQQAKRGGAGADGEQLPDLGDGTVDVTFHSPEWHAARIAAMTQERMSWEDFKKKQKDEASLEAAAAQDEEKATMEFRAQLDADRAARLAKGTNNVHLKDDKKRKRSEKDKSKGKDKKSKKEKEKKKKKGKDKKTRKDSKSSSKKRRRSSSSDRGSDSSSSDSEASEPKPKKRSSPVRLSEFLKD